MYAALTASDKTVSSLLSWGADPDRTADNGQTALIWRASAEKTQAKTTALIMAIQSKCLTTINLLAPVTTVSLGTALYWIAREKVQLQTGELRQLVVRAGRED